MWLLEQLLHLLEWLEQWSRFLEQLSQVRARSEQIERVQKQVLQVIRPEICYPEALLANGLQTLANGRVIVCNKFATQLVKDPELRIWLPRTQAQAAHGLNLCSNNRLISLPSKSRCVENSPIAYFINLLIDSDCMTTLFCWDVMMS